MYFKANFYLSFFLCIKFQPYKNIFWQSNCYHIVYIFSLHNLVNFFYIFVDIIATHNIGIVPRHCSETFFCESFARYMKVVILLVTMKVAILSLVL